MPLLESNAVLEETVPVARSVEDLCRIGREALVAAGARANARDAAWTKKRLAAVDEARQGQGGNTDPRSRRGIRALVTAAGSAKTRELRPRILGLRESKNSKGLLSAS